MSKHLTFWKVWAILSVAALFYVGHALHNPKPIPLIQSANAQIGGVSGGSRFANYATASQDGQTLCLWGFKQSAGAAGDNPPNLVWSKAYRAR